MLCTVKGRDEDGYPLEGIDVIPDFPPREKNQEESNTIPKLVQLLQDANRRTNVDEDTNNNLNLSLGMKLYSL